MSREARHKHPNIVPCLVQPFEKACEDAGLRYAALVFARRGPHILFAAEHARRFGVGRLDAAGEITHSTQYPTLDSASHAFLAAPMGREA
jgi:hypothetical protein